MKREEAEALAEAIHQMSLQRFIDNGIMTEGDRKTLGIPDVREALMESVVESLLDTELSADGQVYVDGLLAKRRKEAEG